MLESVLQNKPEKVESTCTSVKDVQMKVEVSKRLDATQILILGNSAQFSFNYRESIYISLFIQSKGTVFMITAAVTASRIFFYYFSII